MVDLSTDAPSLANAAALATLAISIGNLIFTLARSGVSRDDLRRQGEYFRGEILKVQEQWSRDFLSYQKHQAELRHDLLNHFSSLITPLQKEEADHEIECSKDRRQLSERLSKLEK